VTIASNNDIDVIFTSTTQTSPTNYKTGIDTTFSGSEGTDYQEEYFFSDKLISDRKVVYIKSTTAITLSHNARR
jgi:hypothetical protein